MSLFKHISGLLQFNNEIPEPSFWKGYKYNTAIYGIKSKIDHIVINFNEAKSLRRYFDELVSMGGYQSEQYGIYPDDFSNELNNFPEDLKMFFTGIKISNGTLILIAPVHKDDQLSEFINKRSVLAIHHLAFRTNNITKSIKKWSENGFNKLSEPFIDDNFSQVFLSNKYGQIIEIIKHNNRMDKSLGINNIEGLRLSELKR